MFLGTFWWFFCNCSTPRQCHRQSQIFTAPCRFSECRNWYHFDGSFLEKRACWLFGRAFWAGLRAILPKSRKAIFPQKQTLKMTPHLFATRKIRSLSMNISDVSWHCPSVGPEPSAQKWTLILVSLFFRWIVVGLVFPDFRFHVAFDDSLAAPQTLVELVRVQHRDLGRLQGHDLASVCFTPSVTKKRRGFRTGFFFGWFFKTQAHQNSIFFKTQAKFPENSSKISSKLNFSEIFFLIWTKLYAKCKISFIFDEISVWNDRFYLLIWIIFQNSRKSGKNSRKSIKTQGFLGSKLKNFAKTQGFGNSIPLHWRPNGQKKYTACFSTLSFICKKLFIINWG